MIRIIVAVGIVCSAGCKSAVQKCEEAKKEAQIVWDNTLRELEASARPAQAQCDQLKRAYNDKRMWTPVMRIGSDPELRALADKRDAACKTANDGALLVAAVRKAKSSLSVSALEGAPEDERLARVREATERANETCSQVR